jgi:hypothetical protein
MIVVVHFLIPLYKSCHPRAWSWACGKECIHYALKYYHLFYIICYKWSSVIDCWFHRFAAEEESHPDILNITSCNDSFLDKLIVTNYLLFVEPESMMKEALRSRPAWSLQEFSLCLSLQTDWKLFESEAFIYGFRLHAGLYITLPSVMFTSIMSLREAFTFSRWAVSSMFKDHVRIYKSEQWIQ